MGYTQYFATANEAALVKMLPALARDTRLIINAAARDGIRIVGPNATGKPILNDERIAFNGDDSTDEGYESFILCPGVAFNFCKTGRMPYDAVVTAVLLRAHHLDSTALLIESDGTVDDWQAGSDLCRRVFGKDKHSFPPAIRGLTAA